MAHHHRRRQASGTGLSARPAAPSARLPGYRPNGYRNRESSGAPPASAANGQEPRPRSRFKRLWSRIGRFPAMVGGLVLGALIPWTVNAYAPRAVEKVAGTPVLEVAAGHDQDHLADGWDLALPRPVSASEVPKTVDSCAALRRWGVSQGAADVHSSWLLLTFRGTRLQPVSVTSIRVVIDSRTDNNAGARLECASAGGGDAIPVGVSLDEANPVLREVKEDGTLGGPWFSTNTLTLGRDELVTFAVTAYAFKAAYAWHMEVVARSATGEETIVRIPGNYSTTGVSNSYHDYLAWRWDMQPPKLVHSTKPDSI